MSKQRQILKDNNTEYLVSVTTNGYKYMNAVSVIRMVRMFSKEKQMQLFFVYHHLMFCINMLSKVKGCSITGNVNANINREAPKTRN